MARRRRIGEKELDPKRVESTEVDDKALLKALREGDEHAFAILVSRYHNGMIEVARIYLSERAIAEEVVQETWIAVIDGLQGFEERSSLKTWIFRILLNLAKRRAGRESKWMPWAVRSRAGEPRPEVGPLDAHENRRLDSRHWTDSPERDLLSKEAGIYIRAAIDTLPEKQREVITMRDVDGWTKEEVRSVLGISEKNQRALLHRARTRIKFLLDDYVGRDLAKTPHSGDKS